MPHYNNVLESVVCREIFDPFLCIFHAVFKSKEKVTGSKNSEKPGCYHPRARKLMKKLIK